MAATRQHAHSFNLYYPLKVIFSVALPLASAGGHPQRVIGFFWDIENCAIPKNGKAFKIVQQVREYFQKRNGAHEYQFACYGRTDLQSNATRQDLGRANVHCCDTFDSKKGSADRKILEELEKFARHPHHQLPVRVTVVLISGDVDFVSKLSDLRHRCGYEIVLVHNGGAARKELLETANECIAWETLCTLESTPKLNEVNPTAPHIFSCTCARSFNLFAQMKAAVKKPQHTAPPTWKTAAKQKAPGMSMCVLCSV